MSMNILHVKKYYLPIKKIKEQAKFTYSSLEKLSKNKQKQLKIKERNKPKQIKVIIPIAILMNYRMNY